RVLVAEDNAVNQRVARAMLSKLGYAADCVANGVEAVTAVERQHYDLVLMDFHMPELDGIAATREIRRRLRHERPRIVAMTADASESARRQCLAAGMDDFIGKPVTREALVAAIERAWDARHPVGAPAVPGGAQPAGR
ncbi:MAG: response regulator, partial [Acidimicrobiales bacterium]